MLRAPSLRIASARWLSKVRGLICIRSAPCLFEKPSLISLSTSRSRLVSRLPDRLEISDPASRGAGSARLALFRALALDQHRSRIAREAHSLKSTARTFGYLRLATLALQLESAADALGDAQYCDLLERMNSAFTAAKAQEPQD